MNAVTTSPTTSYSAFTPEPLSPAIGAVLVGADLTRPPDAEFIAQVRRALLQYKVVFFRNQRITRDQHIAFASGFGPLEVHPATPAGQLHREILRIEHGPTSKGQENAWHSDVTWRAEPSLGSILRAIEIPPVGGDTLFSCANAAYEALSPGMQRFVCSLTAVHDIARVFARRMKKSVEELHELYPPMEHPVVRTHPETGLPGLYVNTGFTSHIKDLSTEESNWLLAHLYAQFSSPEHQCRFVWAPDSIAFWDNRACQHYAASDYFPQVRVMERVTIAGDRPYYRP